MLKMLLRISFSIRFNPIHKTALKHDDKHRFPSLWEQSENSLTTLNGHYGKCVQL